MMYSQKMYDHNDELWVEFYDKLFMMANSLAVKEGYEIVSVSDYLVREQFGTWDKLYLNYENNRGSTKMVSVDLVTYSGGRNI